jgi:HAD superfamily hydrolase (TIGR01490 family)
MIEREVAIFDFCETLVPFQTGDEFLFTIILDNGTVSQKIIALVLKLKIIKKIIRYAKPKTTMRDILLPITKGIAKDKISISAEKYAKTKLIPSLNPFMRNIIENHQSKNIPILIVSGGYEDYLRLVFEKEKNISIIGTKLEYIDNFTSGKLDGEVCLGVNKVERIKSFVKFEVDANRSSIYSDCLSDMPIFNMVKNNRWLIKLPRQNSGTVSIKNTD